MTDALNPGSSRASSLIMYVGGGALLVLASAVSRGAGESLVLWTFGIGGAIGGAVLWLLPIPRTATRGQRLRRWALSGAVAGAALAAAGIDPTARGVLAVLAGGVLGAGAGVGYCWEFYGRELSGPERRTRQQIVRQWGVVLASIAALFVAFWIWIAAS